MQWEASFLASRRVLRRRRLPRLGHFRVEEMRGPDVLERAQHHGARLRVLALDGLEEARDRLALEPDLRAAQVAGNDRVARELRVARDVLLRALDERADHLEPPVVRRVAGRHGLEPPGEDEVEEEGLEGIVPVVSEGDLVRAEALRRAVDDSSPQPRARSAVGLALPG